MYAAPLGEIRFALELAGLDSVAALPGPTEASGDLVDAVLEEAGKLAAEVLAPLNQPGDREGARLENGVVYTPKGFKPAYRAFVDGGWNGVPFDPDHGGQGLPLVLNAAISEMWSAANLSFALCPLLTAGAAEAIAEHGSDEQKARYLPKMVSGEWTGTMNLTEPQAGSDLSLLKTRAVREGDHYRITGQKIFISYGDHDLADNIIHLVLARTPDAPAGTRGISLFIVPKILVNADGSLDSRNDLRCVSLEHKLGIHASPTAVMAYGDNGGAVGFLVGEENRGLHYMFTMMNRARLAVGLEGVAIAERAYQQAHAFAQTRIQGRDIAGNGAQPVAIIRHPDVARMLLAMRSRTEAMRALNYRAAALLDLARRHPEPAERERAQALADLLVPVCKAWSTDLGVEIASLGVQVHGGMGFVEETGAAQHYRDARILPIYEGSNGIQAIDLFGRKLSRDGGETARRLIVAMRATAEGLGGALVPLKQPLEDGIEVLEQATEWMVATSANDVRRAAAGAVEYLNLLGTVAGGWLLARGALAAAAALEQGKGVPQFWRARITSARFYADTVLVKAPAYLAPITRAGDSVLAFSEEDN
jgi:alkylation response protein AidB-like acyl-CoA dehydrogenase